MTSIQLQRPQTLADVAEIARPNSSEFAMALDEFVDEFYLDHPDKTAQQRRLDVIPYSVANPLIDAWIGAAGVGAPWGQSACFRGLRRVGVWRSLVASETQRHWRARPIFSAYSTFVREVQAACIQKQSHQGGINDHQIDIFRDVPGQADHSWSGTWLDIVGEVTASKMTASEMT